MSVDERMHLSIGSDVGASFMSPVSVLPENGRLGQVVLLVDTGPALDALEAPPNPPLKPGPYYHDGTQWVPFA